MAASKSEEPALPLPGFRYFPAFSSAAEQRSLLQDVLAAVASAGWFQPTMPRTGRPMSVLMCNLGPLGWVTDRRGYRYEAMHPDTGAPWPLIPPSVLRVWQQVAGFPHPPECCLVNLYRAGARMGLHQDRDEQDLTAPVVSISLGDTALFRVGGTTRKAPTSTLELRSGDVVVLGGEARLCFHGIDRILAGTSDLLSGCDLGLGDGRTADEPLAPARLLPHGGRINLTMRRVTLPGQGVVSKGLSGESR